MHTVIKSDFDGCFFYKLMLERPNNNYFWKTTHLSPTFKRKLIT